MRLTKRQIEAIHRATLEAFGLRVRVRLFGSSVNDNAKGRDIDLLIECPEPIENAGHLHPGWLQRSTWPTGAI